MREKTSFLHLHGSEFFSTCFLTCNACQMYLLFFLCVFHIKSCVQIKKQARTRRERHKNVEERYGKKKGSKKWKFVLKEMERNARMKEKETNERKTVQKTLFVMCC